MRRVRQAPLNQVSVPGSKIPCAWGHHLRWDLPQPVEARRRPLLTRNLHLLWHSGTRGLELIKGQGKDEGRTNCPGIVDPLNASEKDGFVQLRVSHGRWREMQRRGERERVNGYCSVTRRGP